MQAELWGALLRLVFFFPLVLILAYVTLKLSMGRRQFQSSGSMRVVDRLAMGPKAMLCVVEVAGKFYLIAVTERDVSLLKELTGYEPVHVQPEASFSFTRLLGARLNIFSGSHGSSKIETREKDDSNDKS